eukprot:2671682-Pyramimonas_sp.AAC.1
MLSPTSPFPDDTWAEGPGPDYVIALQGHALNAAGLALNAFFTRTNHAAQSLQASQNLHGQA